jgi:putative ABC transport system permease protein
MTLGAIGVAIVVLGLRPTAATGLLTTALVAAGGALVARPTLALAGPVLHAVGARVGGPVVRLATASLVRNPRRTALTVATLTAGLGCVVWFSTMAASFRRSLIDTLSAAIRADLVLVSAHAAAGWVEAPVSEALLAEASALPGVAAVVGSRVIDWPHAGRRIAIEGIDGHYFTDPRLGRWPLGPEHIPEVWERVAHGEAAVVSANFVVDGRVRVGEPLVLDTPNGPLTLIVGGVTAAFESPGGTVQVSRELLRRHWQDRLVNRIGVKVAPDASIDAVRAAIARDQARRYDLRILATPELVAHYASQVRRAFAPLHVLAATVLLVTLLGVADTLFAGVRARARELGTVRAVGVRRLALAGTVVVEALLMGALGLGLAATTGLGLALLWVRDTLPHLLGWVLDLHVPYRQAPALVLLTIAVCAAAAVLPARAAGRIPPALALRQE